MGKTSKVLGKSGYSLDVQAEPDMAKESDGDSLETLQADTSKRYVRKTQKQAHTGMKLFRSKRLNQSLHISS